MKLVPQRGEVWVANLDPIKGHEQGRLRPCIIISADEFNLGPSQLVVALPLTSKQKPYGARVTVQPPEGGLARESYVMCEQIRVMSLRRFSTQPIGKVSLRTLSAIEKTLGALLGFNSTLPAYKQAQL